MAMKPALLTAMSGSPVLMQGWLNKAPSSSFGKAENRFFVLSGITMKYYDSEQMAPTNLKGKFVLVSRARSSVRGRPECRR